MKQNKLFNYKNAFTIAEILITLGIIGVVAAYTIPTLMNNYQKTQYIVGLQKGYSTVNQALKQMAADYGCVNDLKCTGLFTGEYWQAQTKLGDELVKHFKIIKNCKNVQGQGCFASKIVINYDGSLTNGYADISDNYNYTYKFITNDGMSIGTQNSATNCGYNGGGASGPMNQQCGYVIIDVNGPKGPNYMGRDVFMFFITNGKGALLYPQGGVYVGGGWWKSNNLCTETNKDGYSCSGRILEESWVMNY